MESAGTSSFVDDDVTPFTTYEYGIDPHSPWVVGPWRRPPVCAYGPATCIGRAHDFVEGSASPHREVGMDDAANDPRGGDTEARLLKE